MESDFNNSMRKLIARLFRIPLQNASVCTIIMPYSFTKDVYVLHNANDLEQFIFPDGLAYYHFAIDSSSDEICNLAGIILDWYNAASVTGSSMKLTINIRDMPNFTIHVTNSTMFTRLDIFQFKDWHWSYGGVTVVYDDIFKRTNVADLYEKLCTAWPFVRIQVSIPPYSKALTTERLLPESLSSSDVDLAFVLEKIVNDDVFIADTLFSRLPVNVINKIFGMASPAYDIRTRNNSMFYGNSSPVYDSDGYASQYTLSSHGPAPAPA